MTYDGRSITRFCIAELYCDGVVVSITVIVMTASPHGTHAPRDAAAHHGLSPLFGVGALIASVVLVAVSAAGGPQPSAIATSTVAA
jgi:hypothetical protein